MFVRTISSEPQNILFANLVCLCSIISQNAMQKNWFIVFSVKVTVSAYIIKIWLFLLYQTTGWIATKLGLIVQHHNPECPVEKWVYFVQGQGHSECSKCRWLIVGMIFSESQNILLPNLVRWCSTMSQSVMWIFCCCCYCYLQGQGHSEGSYDQNMTISTTFSELLIPWQPNLVWWYIIISQSILWKK